MATRKLKAVLTAEDRASGTLKRFGGVLTGLGAVAATVGVVQLGRKLVGGIKAAVEASAVQEKAEATLAQAIRNTGQSVSDVLPKLKAQASSLQNLTGVGDELILQNQALLVSLGGLRGEGLERATKAALDLAGAGIKTETAFDLIAKAASGYTSTLSRYGIILDESLSKEEKFAAALEKIETLFGGQAAAQLDTFQGRLGELQGRFGDLQEAIGGPFREVLTAVFRDVLSPTVKDLGDAAAESDRFRNAVISLGIAFAQFGKISAEAVGQLLTWATILSYVPGTVFKNFRDGLDLLKVSIEGLSDGEAVTTLGKRFELLIENLEKLRGQTPASEITGGLAAGLEAANEAAQPFSETVKVIADNVITTEEAVNRMGDIGFTALNAQVQTAAVRIEDFSDTISRNLRNEGIGSAAAIGDALVDAAEQGSFAWGKFFKQLLKDFIRAIVRALILKAIVAAITGGGAGVQSYGVGVGTAYRKGGIVGARNGYLVGGFDRGRDSVPIIARPGEAVLPKELTDFLMRAAAARSGSMPTEIIVRTDVPSFVEIVSDNVNRGTARLVATETRTGRGVR